MKFIKEISSYIIIALTVVLIRYFVVTPVIVSGSSMDDTLKEGEFLILNKIALQFEEIERFEIVVIDDGNSLIIKRVIGLPGDKVEYKDNVLYINDEVVEDIYAKGETSDFDIKDICRAGRENGTFNKRCTFETVPDDYYLVLGDNRVISSDSRNKGFISTDQIKGKTGLRIWPLNKIGVIK